jgi:hypothetical protein
MPYQVVYDEIQGKILGLIVGQGQATALRAAANNRAASSSCMVSSAARPLAIARGGRCRPVRGPKEGPYGATV